MTEVTDGVTNTIEFDTLDAYKPGNYDVAKDEGTLSVMANQDEVTVGIAGNSISVVYDGTEKSVSGYDVTSISGNLFAEKDIVFSGTAEAKGTDAGTYEMGLAAGKFANGNTNFGNVKFDVTDGKLTVRPQSISPPTTTTRASPLTSRRTPPTTATSTSGPPRSPPPMAPGSSRASTTRSPTTQTTSLTWAARSRSPSLARATTPAA